MGPMPRWVRVRSDYPRATSTGPVWVRARGEAYSDPRWVVRTAAHRAYAASLRRRGVFDTRWQTR